MKSVASLSAAAALLAGSADAFWRMPCHSRTALARLDPIVDKGVASSHGHVIHGGSNFGKTTTYDDLRNSDCTSCAFNDDKSAYWTPSLHFVHASGEVEIVPQIGGMLSYYMLIGENIKAFPKDFEMLAGDSRLRNFTGPVPDPPTSAWGPEDLTQESLGQKAIGFNCMNYNKAPEGSRYRHFMPDKQFLDQNCADGIRAELFFPSCWNGKDSSSPDHKSHVAYPSNIDGGSCPKGYETRLPSLFYETIWATNKFNGKDGQFVWSNGDPTGYGYHGDFMNGWNIDTLQAAVEQCTNLSGRVEDCPVFASNLQSEAKQGKCEIQKMPTILEADDCAGPAKGLCGNVPVQYGPGYANPLHPGSPDKPSAPPVISSVSVPTQDYAPARSEGPGGVSVYNAVPTDAAPKPIEVPVIEKPAPKAPVVEKPAPKPVEPYAEKPSAPAPPAPIVTPAPANPPAGAPGKIIGTSSYLSNGVEYIVAIEEVEVVVYVTEDGTKMRNKRHAHAQAHARRHAERRA